MKKKIISLIITLIGFLNLYAGQQSVNLVKGNVFYSFNASETGLMTFSDGKTITIAGNKFTLAEFDAIKVLDFAIDRQVYIQYNDDRAYVVIPGEFAQYVSAEIDGANVRIIQSDLVSDSTTGEITYIINGQSDNGSLVQEGSYKSTFYLNNVSLTNPTGAAIDIENSKRIKIDAAPETINTFADGTGGKQKAAIYCKGHLEFEGTGTINVTGKTAHAISAKEYIEIKKCTINIDESVKDGINCNQYFLMKSGEVTIVKPGDDGLQVSYKDATDREAEDTGALTIKGGKLTIGDITANAAKGLKCEGDFTISGGEVSIKSTANGLWDSAKSKTKASACIGADGNVLISGGVLDLIATGSGGKGISCDGVFTSEAGNVTIATTGGMLVYTNGSLNHNYTSSADRINSDYKSSSKGIKADSGVIINGGDFHITTATNNAEGIESKTTLAINGGNVFVKAYDDGINSAKDFIVSGGNLTVISIVGDGLDSNGNLTISGGNIITMGSGGMEMGLDAATENGCAVYITGGTLLAFGGNNTYPTKSGSIQPFVKGTGSVKANTDVVLKSGDSVLASFTIPAEYNSTTANTPMFGPGNGPGGGGWNPGGSSGSGSIMISCPALTTGTSYTLVNDTVSSTVTATLTSSGR